MRKRSLNDKKKLCGHFGLVYHAEQWKLCSSSWSMRPWPMHNDAFIYLFFHFWFFFFFLFLWGGRAVGGTYAWPVVVWFWLTYVIHVQTLWSSQSIFMLLKRLSVWWKYSIPYHVASYSNHRQGDWITCAADRAQCVNVCASIWKDAVYTRAPLIAIIVLSRSRSDILRGTNLCLSGSSARPFQHLLWPGVITGSGLVSSTWLALWLWRKVERERDWYEDKSSCPLALCISSFSSPTQLSAHCLSGAIVLLSWMFYR